MTKIGITGSNGFIGNYLFNYLSSNEFYSVCRIRRLLDGFLQEDLADCDVVIHCAGVNRPDSQNPLSDNLKLTSDLLSKLSDESFLLYLSSQQASIDNEYGQSKKKAEDLIFQNHRNCNILRLPNVFGAGSKPFYNSVVATFCYQTSQKIDHTVHDPEKEVELMWVGDLAVLIRERLSASVPSEEVESRFHYTSKICVGRLSELIHQLGDNIRDGISDVTERSFRWKLETTLLSFFEPNLSRSLHPHCDHRGVFVELLKTQSGQISVLECEVNKERGLHFHLAKYERFFVVKGKALFRAQHVSGGDIYEKEVCSPEYTEVFTSPLYVHSIKNIGEDTLIVVIWSNENFRPDNPDTVFARFK